MYARIDMLNELGRLISGAPTKTPVSEIARWAMTWVEFGISKAEADKEVQELERIYKQQ